VRAPLVLGKRGKRPASVLTEQPSPEVESFLFGVASRAGASAAAGPEVSAACITSNVMRQKDEIPRRLLLRGPPSIVADVEGSPSRDPNRNIRTILWRSR